MFCSEKIQNVLLYTKEEAAENAPNFAQLQVIITHYYRTRKNKFWV